MKLVYSANIEENKFNFEYFNEIAEKYGKIDTSCPLFGVLMLATLEFYKEIKENTDLKKVDVIGKIKPNLHNLLKYWIIHSAILTTNFTDLLKNSTLSKPEFSKYLKMIVSNFLSSPMITPIFFSILKQIIVLLSVYMPWDAEFRNELVNQVKTENFLYFVNYALASILRLDCDFSKFCEQIMTVFENNEEIEKLCEWVKNIIKSNENNEKIHLFIYTIPIIPNIIDLPENYESVILKYYKQVCQNCNLHNEHTALCLYCGKIVCFDKCCEIEYMENEGVDPEIKYHTKHCGLDSGYFLAFYEGSIIVTYGEKLTTWGSIYENSAGEQVSKLFKHNQYIFSYQLRKYKLSNQRLSELIKFVSENKEHGFVKIHTMHHTNNEMLQNLLMMLAQENA